VWKPSVIPLDFENRHIRTIGSNQDSRVLAKLLAGLSVNAAHSIKFDLCDSQVGSCL